MDEIGQTNKVKILEELQKNARTSLSQLSKKTGLSRQTVAKTINDMEKKKQIWGYTTIFDPRLIGKKPFIFLFKLDLSISTEEFFKIVTSSKLLKDHEEKYGVKTSMFLNGNRDIFALIWAKNLIDTKKLLNNYKIILGQYITEIDLLEVLTTFRSNGIANPKMVDEWTNLLL